MTPPVLELAGISKDYRGLRPLRIERLIVMPGDGVALLGLDLPMAETLVNLATGATLPDRGDAKIFGRSTAAITDSADWLAVVDRFGIVSERAVLLDQLSVVQNLSMPFTLEIEPPPDDVRERAGRLAAEVGFDVEVWELPVAALDPLGRARVRLGRALALDPALLLVEHASAGLERADAERLARDIRAIADRRGVAVLAVTADEAFAGAVAARVVTLQAATGRLVERRSGLLGWLRGTSV